MVTSLLENVSSITGPLLGEFTSQWLHLIKDHDIDQWPVSVWSLQWRHNERDGVSNHQPHYCLLNRLLRRRSKTISKLCVTGLYEGNPPVTGGLFPFDDVIMNTRNIVDPQLNFQLSTRRWGAIYWYTLHKGRSYAQDRSPFWLIDWLNSFIMSLSDTVR